MINPDEYAASATSRPLPVHQSANDDIFSYRQETYHNNTEFCHCLLQQHQISKDYLLH